jgi:hypothetical protein
MAKAIFAGEEVEELPDVQPAAPLALSFTELPWLAENFLMGHCPRNTRDGQSQQHQEGELMRESVRKKIGRHVISDEEKLRTQSEEVKTLHCRKSTPPTKPTGKQLN